MDGRNPGDDRIAALERKVESLTKTSTSWWKDKGVFLVFLGLIIPGTTLGFQRLDARSKENLERSRHYAEREAFAIKMALDAKSPEERTATLEILTVLDPPSDDDSGDRNRQWALLLGKLSDQLGKALQRGEFRDEIAVDRALEATNQAAVAVESRFAAQGPPPSESGEKADQPTQTAPTKVALATLRRAAKTLADKSIREKAFARPDKPAATPPRRPGDVSRPD